MANFVTSSYFLYFIALLPIIGFIENAVIHAELKKISQGTTTYSLGFLPILTLMDLSDSKSVVENFVLESQQFQLGFFVIAIVII